MPKFIKSYNEIIPQKSLRKLERKHLRLQLAEKEATSEFIYQNIKQFVEYHPDITIEFDQFDTKYDN